MEKKVDKFLNELYTMLRIGNMQNELVTNW